MKDGELQYAPLIRRLDVLSHRLDRIQARLDDIVRRMDSETRETHLTVQTK